MARPVMSKEEREKQYERYRQYERERLTIREVAEREGVCGTSASNMAKRLGLKLAPDRKSRFEHPKELIDQIRDYASRGFSDLAISMRIPYSQGRIASIRKRYGIPAAYSPKPTEKIMSCYDPNKSLRLCAKEAGLKLCQYRRRIRKEGIPASKVHTNRPPKEELEKLVANNMSDVAIGKLYNVSGDAVFVWRKRYGIARSKALELGRERARKQREIEYKRRYGTNESRAV